MTDIDVALKRVSPKLDVLLGGSTEVNEARAASSACVAAGPEPTPAPASRFLALATADLGNGGVDLVDDDLAAPAVEPIPLATALEASSPLPETTFSLFVQLDPDLDREDRSLIDAIVARNGGQVLWRQDVATVELTGPGIAELLDETPISYVELGQTLVGPAPIVEGSGAPPAPPGSRRVATQREHHQDGAGVLVGIIDVQGFDFAHPHFLRDDGTTRWHAIWDQAGKNRPSPAKARGQDQSGSLGALDYGAEITADRMHDALVAAEQQNVAATQLEPQKTMTPGSHGTHVASIAAGNEGVAPGAVLAGVLIDLDGEKLPATSSFYDSTRIAHAIEYLLTLAAELGERDHPTGDPLPLSINISLGTNGHAHDTSSAMARWIDNALATPGRCVTVAAGNAGQIDPRSATDLGYLMGRIHAGGSFAGTNLRQELGWVVGDAGHDDISDNELEIWYGPQDRFAVQLRHPDGTWTREVLPGQKVRNEALGRTVVSIVSETYYPMNGANRIQIILSPDFGQRPPSPMDSGEWRVRLTGLTVRDGRYDAWIERDDFQRQSGRVWRYPSSFAAGSFTGDRMISSLACAERLIAVANIDVSTNSAHPSSSRGPTRDGRFKPDVGANGTSVVAARGFDRSEPTIAMTGTSMASPYICGVAALMLAVEPDLTSAQIIGIMRATSSPLPGHDYAWRNDTGFGLIDAEKCLGETAVFAGAREVGQL